MSTDLEKRSRKATNAHLKRVQSGMVNVNPDEQVSMHLLAVLRPPPVPEETSVHLKRVLDKKGHRL